jgi:hypothetical protein
MSDKHLSACTNWVDFVLISGVDLHYSEQQFYFEFDVLESDTDAIDDYSYLVLLHWHSDYCSSNRFEKVVMELVAL